MGQERSSSKPALILPTEYYKVFNLHGIVDYFLDKFKTKLYDYKYQKGKFARMVLEDSHAYRLLFKQHG